MPERERRAYRVQPIIETLADEGSVTFLRERFAPEMVTALARIEGRPLGVLANSTMHMAGAITSEGADKAARFLQLCDAFGLPVVSLVDTPGMMVGPEAEATGLVRHASRLLVAGAALRVPVVAVVLRRGYGLGAQAMTMGSLHEPLLTVAWPSAHLGPMGLEGAVRLGLRKELEAIEDEAERERRVREVTAARPGERPGPQRRPALRARRRDRPGRDPGPDRRHVRRRDRPGGAAARPPLHRHLVGQRPRAAGSGRLSRGGTTALSRPPPAAPRRRRRAPGRRG